MPVHPHACGERRSRVGRPSSEPGSSPRLWGTHRFPATLGVRFRFIPTPVGNASPVYWKPGNWPVHPHACGERFSCFPVVRSNDGSSPRLWGTLHFFFSSMHFSRFIPTPVGNAIVKETGLNVVAVHPHACGERLSPPASLPRSSGSSPRLWGTQSSGNPPFLKRRFIPTPVGNAPFI